jgi:hypothetical protein
MLLCSPAFPLNMRALALRSPRFYYPAMVELGVSQSAQLDLEFVANNSTRIQQKHSGITTAQQRPK